MTSSPHLSQLRSDETIDSWELLTQDALSREEQALLRALADENEADGLRMEAYAPLEQSFLDRMTDRFDAQLAESARFRRRRMTFIATTTSLLAAAACLVLMVQPPLAKAPEYGLVIQGQVATERGAPETSGPLRLTPGSLLDIRLTPATRVTERMILSAFLEHDGKVVPWNVHAERADSGAFRIHGPAHELLKTQYGELDANFVIGPQAVSEPPLEDMLQDEFTVERARLSYHPDNVPLP